MIEIGNLALPAVKSFVQIGINAIEAARALERLTVALHPMCRCEITLKTPEAPRTPKAPETSSTSKLLEENASLGTLEDLV